MVKGRKGRRRQKSNRGKKGGTGSKGNNAASVSKSSTGTRDNKSSTVYRGDRGVEAKKRENTNQKLWILYVVSAIIIIAIGVRFLGIGTESIWLDEAISIQLSSQDWGGVIESALVNDVHPPLYYLVLKAFMVLGSSEAAVRLPSLVFGVLAVGLTYLVGRETLGRERGMIAATLMAVSGFAIFYSQEARMYSMLSALVLATFYFYLQALKLGGWRNWGLVSAFALLSIYTHYFAVMPLAAIFIHFLYRWAGERRAGITTHKRFFTISFAVVMAGCLPLLAAIFTGAAGKVNIFDLPVDVQRYISEFLAKTSGSMFPMANYDGITDTWLLNSNVILLSFTVAAMVLFGFYSVYRRRGSHMVLLLLWLFVPLVIGLVLVYFINFHQRYLLFTLAPYLLFAAEGIWWLAGLPDKFLQPSSTKYSRKKYTRNEKKRRGKQVPEGTVWRPYVAIIIVAVIFLISMPSLNSLYGGYQKEDWRGAAILIAENAQPGDAVVCIPNYVHMPLDYSLGLLGVDTVQVNVGDNATAIANSISSYERCWVVVSSDVAYLPDIFLIEQWVLSNVYSMPSQPFGLFVGIYID